MNNQDNVKTTEQLMATEKAFEFETLDSEELTKISGGRIVVEARRGGGGGKGGGGGRRK
jgi:bacteriocin-like protein